MAARAHSRYVTVADQVVSSGSNFALVALIAHASSPVTFGQFSLGYVVLIFFLGLQRALIGEIMLVRHAKIESRPAGVDSAASGLALIIGILGILVFGIGALTIGRSDPLVWLILGICMPVVFIQDTLRYVFISRGHSGFALLIDAVWIVLAIGPMAWFAATISTPEPVIAAWGGGALIAAIIGFIVARVRPRPIAGVRWFLEHRQMSIRFSVEFASVNLSNTLVWFVLAPFLTIAGVAALRGAMLLFSPLNTLFNSMYIAVLPELIRATDKRMYRKRLLESAILVGGICLVWDVVVLLLPTSIGELVLGQSWESASAVRFPYAIQAAAMVAFTVLRAHFRGRGLFSEGTRMRFALVVATLVLPPTLALAFGQDGAAWGFAGAVALASGAGVLILLAARRRRAKAAASSAPETEPSGEREAV